MAFTTSARRGALSPGAWAVEALRPHPGVSLFVEATPDGSVIAPDDVTEPPGPSGPTTRSRA
jgi:hypothetical protein